MSLQYSLAKLTKQGGRDYNEDTFGADEDRGIYVVADGLGGHGGGSEASRIAVKSMMELLSDANFDDGSLQEAILKTNELILSHQNHFIIFILP